MFCFQSIPRILSVIPIINDTETIDLFLISLSVDYVVLIGYVFFLLFYDRFDGTRCVTVDI